MRKYMQDAAPKILNCQDFKGESFSGKAENTKNGKIVYVLYSYTTPIAFFIGKWRKDAYQGAWYITRQRFSQTTTNQQASLKSILWDKTVLWLGTADFTELLRDAVND